MKKGLTVVELVIYLSIISVILVVVVDLAFNLVAVQTKTAGSFEVQQNGKFVSQKIEYYAERAEEVANQASDALSITVDGQPVVIKLENNAIKISENGGAFENLTNSKVIASALPDQNIFSTIDNGGNITVKYVFKIALASNIQASESFQSTVKPKGIQ